jgi:hypothetical protein
MDATANDVSPTYDVKGFPTLFWLPKDSKDAPILYEGGRDVDEISSSALPNTHGGRNGDWKP